MFSQQTAGVGPWGPAFAPGVQIGMPSGPSAPGPLFMPPNIHQLTALKSMNYTPQQINAILAATAISNLKASLPANGTVGMTQKNFMDGQYSSADVESKSRYKPRDVSFDGHQEKGFYLSFSTKRIHSYI